MPVKPRRLLSPPAAFSDYLPPAGGSPHTVIAQPRPPATRQRTPQPTRCGDAVQAAGLDLVCTLPAGHKGPHAHVRDADSSRNRERDAKRLEARRQSRT